MNYIYTIKGGGELDFELVVGQTFPGVFEVPDPPAPAWRHAQI